MPCKNRIFTSVYLLYPISRHTYLGAADLNNPLVQNQSETEHTNPQPWHRKIKDFIEQKSLVTKFLAIVQTIRQWVLPNPVKYSHNQLRATLAISPKLSLNALEVWWTSNAVYLNYSRGSKPRPSSTYPVRF